jgi:phospholipid/cholesterol/gamma-HCH transport system substrate-binding protein
MNPRMEWKVGLFVTIGLVLIAALMINFSKGLSLFKPTYEIVLRTGQVGGLKKNAAVLMSGLQIGFVAEADLSPDGKSVLIRLKIFERYKIHSDALFVTEQAGFLGDQYVSIIPQENEGPYLKEGDEVIGQEPFNIQEAARAALGLIQRVDRTVANLNQAVVRVDQNLLSEATLNNLTSTVVTFRQISERALTTVNDLNLLVQSNKPAVNISLSNIVQFTEHLSAMTNLAHFSEQMTSLADKLHETLAGSRGDITSSLENLEAATGTAKDLLADLQAGKGVAGSLLKDEQMAGELAEIIGNLNVLSSNLNRFGLLYKPKPVKTNTVTRPSIYPGRTPFK